MIRLAFFFLPCLWRRSWIYGQGPSRTGWLFWWHLPACCHREHQIFGCSCRTSAAPCRDYHRRNRRRGCETHGACGLILGASQALTGLFLALCLLVLWHAAGNMGRKKNRKKQKEEKEQAYPLVPFLFAGMLIGIWIGG